jgi:hypothetical protein
MRNYWTALLLPADKVADNPDAWRDVSNYDNANWRGWLCLNPDTVGDTWDPVKLDGLREFFGIYHYLQTQGVVGRWVHVFRPVVTGDDPTMYFQRMSRDGQRGIVIPKRVAPGRVTIKPKGLIPPETYVVNYQESRKVENRTGADLMAKGITLEKMAPGELIYLNLPMHPGSPLDKEPPKPPSAVAKARADNMGFPGVELKWQPGSDNNWIYYYEILRGGAPLDKVAKGTFYFDHSAGADLATTYEVRTVDGAGNVSERIPAQGPAVRPSRIIDDAPRSGISYGGDWKHLKEEPLVAYNGTITASNVKGTTAELAFEGKRCCGSPSSGRRMAKQPSASMAAQLKLSIRTLPMISGESPLIARSSLLRDGTPSTLKFWASAARIRMSDQKTHSSSWMEFGLKKNREKQVTPLR